MDTRSENSKRFNRGMEVGSMLMGIPVFISPLLPMPNMVSVCDVKSREEYKIQQGETHSVLIGQKYGSAIWQVSQQLFDKLKEVDALKTT